MTEELGTVEGISRRDMLKRSAIVGGGAAMVWAAPSVTTFGARAFGDNGTPASDFSNYGAVIDCGGTRYRIKADYDEKTDVLKWSLPGTLGGCESAFGDAFFEDWCDSTPADGGTLGVGFDFGEDIVLRAPAGCTFIEGAASSLKQGQCCYEGTVSGDGTTLTWYGPFSNGAPCLDGNGNEGFAPGSPTKCP